MTDAFPNLLRRYAEVIVKVGANLRPGQRVFLAEPFELQGVSPDAAPLVDAVREVALAAGASELEVIWGDPVRLRAAAERWPDREFEARLAEHTRAMGTAVERGDAIVFLQGSTPGLLAGLDVRRVAAFRERIWQFYGCVAPDLVAGRTNWTVAPAPVPAWAAAVFPEEPGESGLERLWQVVFEACRVLEPEAVAAWSRHMAALEIRRDELNRARHRSIRFTGPGTDLSVELAPGHVWCTANLGVRGGRSCVANLPTEEVFTAPHRRSADGRVRVARPVSHGGVAIEGIELEFRRGKVIRARAARGGDLLRRLLATDRGAARLGEVALVEHETAAARSGRCFFQALLDENALPHIALGDGYPFTVRPEGEGALNHSLVHVDLPIEAEVSLL